jgi:outer membrane protein assembly factor BamD
MNSVRVWAALRLGIVVLGCVAMAGCGLFGKEFDPTEGWNAQRLYNAGKVALDDGDYSKATEFYQKLETRYPFGPFAQQAQLESVYAYYKMSEPASAIAAADRFIKLNPQHPHADYAYYLKGLTQFDQGRGLIDKVAPIDPSQRDPGSALESFEDFAELVRRFPNSRYTKDAQRRMLFLRNNLARHEMHVANYYLRRGAYVAAANRAKYVVENYDRAPAVPDALVLMAKTYRVLGLDELSADAVRVLKLNHPEHPGISEVQKLQLRD